MLIPEEKIAQYLKDKVTGVVHIGAHKCEELNFYHKIGLKNKDILWIEANPKLVEEIEKNNKNLDENKINIVQAMLAEVDDETRSFMITNNGQSSSFLEFGTHKNLYREVVEVERERRYQKRR